MILPLIIAPWLWGYNPLKIDGTEGYVKEEGDIALKFEFKESIKGVVFLWYPWEERLEHLRQSTVIIIILMFGRLFLSI